ncbi:hypothetical protein BRADI_1g70705v3 [Brachypodium distachyon]|uniref:Uncharacterized protein n=1 Tax=Brachypodium distachyon TaxID=15368 RepID=A0A2K2DUI7_BRADI|nr:hypothetical protein BRADI_1g70705v3 [Brachypodium distachyon]
MTHTYIFVFSCFDFRREGVDMLMCPQLTADRQVAILPKNRADFSVDQSAWLLAIHDTWTQSTYRTAFVRNKGSNICSDKLQQASTTIHFLCMPSLLCLEGYAPSLFKHKYMLRQSWVCL